MSILWSRRGVALCALLSVAAFRAQGVEPPPPLDRAEVERLVDGGARGESRDPVGAGHGSLRGGAD